MSDLREQVGEDSGEQTPLPTLREQATALPLHPGIYRFLNSKGEVLYVGKAIRLRERVKSYFASDIAETRNPGIEQMVKEATQLTYTLTDSEPEALLLEAREIRRYKPRYNILLRDDKSFLLITIDRTHEYPIVGVARERELEQLLAAKHQNVPTTERIQRKLHNIEYYGPFPSGYAVKSVLVAVRKIWRYRDCNAQKFSHFAGLGHGCMFASVGLCTAPCVNAISVPDYQHNIDQLRHFLRGDSAALVELVSEEMEAAAAKEQYELAAMLRDRLFSLKKFQYMVDTFRARKKVVTEAPRYSSARDIRLECYDISNNQGQYAVGSLISAVVYGAKETPLTQVSEVNARFAFEKGRYRKFKIQSVAGISDTEMLQEVLHRRLKRANQWGLPDMIVIDGGKGQLTVLQRVIAAYPGAASVALGTVAKGPTRKRTDLHGTGWEAFPLVDRACWHRVAEHLREEAHRFAIGYYRQLHRKALVGR